MDHIRPCWRPRSLASADGAMPDALPASSRFPAPRPSPADHLRRCRAPRALAPRASMRSLRNGSAWGLALSLEIASAMPRPLSGGNDPIAAIALDAGSASRASPAAFRRRYGESPPLPPARESARDPIVPVTQPARTGIVGAISNPGINPWRSRLMRLTDFKILTFDCYGTLIDWETASSPRCAAARQAGRQVDDETALELFARYDQRGKLTNLPSITRDLAKTYEGLALDWIEPITEAEAETIR